MEIEPLVWSYILALLASMVVALTVTPAFSALLLINVPDEKGAGSRFMLGTLQRAYDKVGGTAMRSPVPAYVLAGVAAIAGYLMWSQMERSMNQGALVVME